MGEIAIVGGNMGNKIYSLADVTITNGILTLPSGVTYKDIKYMFISGTRLYGEYTYDFTTAKHPTLGYWGFWTYSQVNYFYKISPQPNPSDTSLTVTQQFWSVTVYDVLIVV